MLNTIRKIIGRKCIARNEPLIATDMDVYCVTGKNMEEQLVEAMPLAEKKKIKIGETLNGIYYRVL